MAPGAFERAHSSPRADADAGPAGGTAPDSPRAFLAAMEDGVYGRPGEAGGWSVSQAPPRTAPHWRGAFQRAGRASGAAESRGSRAIVWAEPASGGGGRGGAWSGAGRTPAGAAAWLSSCGPRLNAGLTDPDPGSCCPSLSLLCTPDPDHGVRYGRTRTSVPFQEMHPRFRTPNFPIMMEPESGLHTRNAPKVHARIPAVVGPEARVLVFFQDLHPRSRIPGPQPR